MLLVHAVDVQLLTYAGAGAPALTPTSDPPSKNLQSPPTDDFDADGDDMDEPFSPPADPAATPTSGEDGTSSQCIRDPVCCHTLLQFRKNTFAFGEAVVQQGIA